MNFINIAYAQATSNTRTVDGLVGFVADFINNTLVYLIFALAFAFFLFGVFKYFFSSGKNAEENRREGGKFILWSIIAFAVMICVWGLVNLLVSTVPLNKTRPDLPCFEGTDCNKAPGSSSRTNSNILDNLGNATGE